MNDYANLLVPLITTVGLMLACFVLYIIFGNKLCPSYYTKTEIQRRTTVNEEITTPLDNVSFACKNVLVVNNVLYKQGRTQKVTEGTAKCKMVFKQIFS